MASDPDAERDISSCVSGQEAPHLRFSPGDTAEAWLQAPDLQVALYQHLSRYVPLAFCLPSVSAQMEELLLQLLLLAPLEWYLCGQEPRQGLGLLEGLGRPPALCGHVFHVGEPTYCCRECAADPTCVLCMECFLGSVHKDHRYRMTTSSGGGFCDCGDEEAWKESPYCHKHHVDTGGPGQEDPVALLSEEIVARGYNIFSVLLKYTVDMLTWDRDDLLPAGLEPPSRGDTYVCMLFNDELHTYEQVIYTLQKAIGCSQKEAASFATTVDREGRKSVRYGDFQFCEQAKSVIVRNTSRQSRPLKVQVMHSLVVAHQCFALKALAWLGHTLGHSDGLRRLLCQVFLQEGPDGENSSLVDILMLSDAKMWKGARSVYHQLLMSSLLMDLKYKKLFAVKFAKNYERLQSDYVKDDHDREFSITDLSVQMFTVPSLARMLLVDQGLMSIIIRTFLDHLQHRDLQGRFLFQRYTATQTFKFHRVQSLIGDLKYVLISRPSEWSDPLREKFLEGLDDFLELLKCMQGMDPVVRQVDQHIEMEPEWEAAFTLQMKLTHIICLVQEWCSTDECVLREAYVRCVRALGQCGAPEGEPQLLSLGDHSLEAGRFSVSHDRLSIHLPVSRLLAGLHVLISKNELACRCPEQLPLSELSPPLLIEQPLRCLVLCAQVHAGMWRRNGFSLINQIYYYRNVKCRTEMFDKDVVMLQMGASMMDPNHFLLLLLSRFELLQLFSSPDCRRRYREANKDVLQQNNTLIEEMLHLIIMVIGERYVPGVGQVEPGEDVRREIIHQLSIRPMAHSELLKALPETENKETDVERVIDTVATFRKPGVTGRGLYELRPEWNRHFNLCYYHYSRVEQAKAEEAQRRIRKQNKEDSALPPPCPPPLCPMFASLVKLLHSDVLLLILSSVLQWACEATGGSWTEAMLHRALHLLCLGVLQEQQQLDCADEDLAFISKISRPAEGAASVLALLERLQSTAHLEAHKDLLLWVLKRVVTIKTTREQSASTSSISTCGEQEETVRERDKAERKRKADMARQRREKVLAQMSEMQRSFINDNKELFHTLDTHTHLELELSGPQQSPQREEAPSQLVCVGARRSVCGAGRGSVVRCILCQEEQEVLADGNSMVLASFTQRSTVLSKDRRRSPPDPEKHDPLFMHPDLAYGTHTSSCGHVMHAICWQRYFEAVQQKDQRRQQRVRVQTSHHVEQGEFLCPLCQCLANTVLPLLPPLREVCPAGTQGDLRAWLHSTSQQVAALQAASTTHQDQMDCSSPEGFRLSFATSPYSSSQTEMINTLVTSCYKVGLKVNPNDQDPRVPCMTWSSTAFTVLAIERLLDDEEKPLFGSLPCRQDDCLSSLTQVGSACWITSPIRTSQDHFISLLSAVYPDLQTDNNPCILDIDMFHLLVCSVFSYSSLHCLDQSGRSCLDSAHLHLLQLITVAHLVQVLLTSVEVSMEQDSTGPEGEEQQMSMMFYKLLRTHLDSLLPDVSSGWVLWRCLRAGVRSFIRCSALFFHYLNNVDTPPELHVAGADEWEALCAYLSLPSNLLSLFYTNQSVLEALVERWCCHPAVRRALQTDGLVRFPRASNRLIELPEDYSSLINQASSFTCPKAGGDMARAPTLCLVCGELLCSQSYCCQTELDGHDVGACNAHAHHCGAGLGLFLRVRESQVLLLSGKSKGCFYPPPYLDDYGETDQGLRRGNPLHLCLQRYQRIQRLWLQHSVAEEIGHAQEANQHLVAIDWQHL